MGVRTRGHDLAAYLQNHAADQAARDDAMRVIERWNRDLAGGHTRRNRSIVCASEDVRVSEMKATICGALLVLMITTANGAEEDTKTADFLLPYCKLTTEQAGSSARNALNVGQCMGIVEGISQMFQLLNEAQAVGRVQLDPLLCTSIPVGITTQQLVDVVVKYGATFPELTHRPFTVLAMSAMRVAWPCEK